MGHLNFQCVRSEGEPFPQASDQGTPLTVSVSACKAMLGRRGWKGRTVRQSRPPGPSVRSTSVGQDRRGPSRLGAHLSVV